MNNNNINLNLDYINQCIHNINTIHQTNIPYVKENSEDLIKDIKGWWKILNAKWANERIQETRRDINEKIERRYGMIENDQKKMIQSLLNKPWKKIQLDRIFDFSNNERNLLVEPEEILLKT